MTKDWEHHWLRSLVSFSVTSTSVTSTSGSSISSFHHCEDFIHIKTGNRNITRTCKVSDDNSLAISFAWHQFFCENILHSSPQIAFNLNRHSSHEESLFKSLNRSRSLNEINKLFVSFYHHIEVSSGWVRISRLIFIRVLILICRKSLNNFFSHPKGLLQY